MPPKKDTNKAAEPLTEREKAIMLEAWAHMEQSPKLKTNALAAHLGYTNPRTLTNALCSIKGKLGLTGSFVGNKRGATSLTAPVPTAKNRLSDAKSNPKRKAGAMEEDAINEDEPAIKKAKKRGANSSIKGKNNGKRKSVTFAEEAEEFPDAEVEDDDDH
ncbi:hypothetical protein GGR55DRAFT_696497 [Xylaria sp. FL0064]|nr:hypothetical protein GGR55DRAFT_696497 [Xylaria sp. FL0064]